MRGPAGREAQRPFGRAGRACGDHQPFLGEPAAGQFVTLAYVPEHRVRAHPDVVEGELGVLIDEGVRVARRAHDRDPRSVPVDQEQRRCVLGFDGREHDQEVGHVADGDEPFIPGDPVAVAVPDG